MPEISQENLVIFLTALAALAAGGVIAFALTPLVRLLAFRINAVDVPKDGRRMHTKPMPLIGGVAIFAAFAASSLIFGDRSEKLIGTLIGGAIIVILGVLDDKFDLNPFVKLLGQVLAAQVLIAFGMKIEYINIFGKYVVFGFWSYPITIFWVVLLTNAINLIDGLDGLACGVSTIASVSLLIFTVIKGEPEIMTVVAALVGACIGFLPYNTNPARIFMGDTGALMLGFVMSAISLQGLFKFNTVVSFWIPFVLFGLPFGDTFFAFFRRLFTGKHPFKGDRGHLHHRLIDAGFSQRQSVLILYAISALCGASAILFTENRVIGAVTAIVVALAIIFFNLIVMKKKKTSSPSGLPDEGKTDENASSEKGEDK